LHVAAHMTHGPGMGIKKGQTEPPHVVASAAQSAVVAEILPDPAMSLSVCPASILSKS